MRLIASLGVPLLVAPLSACAPSTHDGGNLCPTCEPLAGGETGDLGGTPTACQALSASVAVDAAQARAHGFDVDELERRLARGVDAPFTWTPASAAAGDVPSGFESETSIVASFAMGEMVLTRTDPSTCKAGVCSRDGVEVPEGSCPSWLQVALTVDVETLDGAVSAIAEGTAVLWADGYEDMIGAGTAERVLCQAQADLAETEGRLVLPEPSLSVPYHGALLFEATLERERSKGVLRPVLFHGSVSARRDEVSLLSGSWNRAADAAAGGFDP